MRKIMLTGGAGYIGSHTAHFLSRRGYDVLVYDSLEKGHMESLPRDVKLKVGNTSDFETLDKTIDSFEPDAVIHFAAYIEVGESMKHPQKYYRNNLLNSINLVNAMQNNGVKNIIFSSTAAVYGEPTETPITEDALKLPVNDYGISKLLFERYLATCKDINSVCLRYFNASGAAYGIGEDHDPETHLIPLVLKTVLGQRKEISIFGNDYPTRDGTCVRDYVHVWDLANAHYKSLDVVEAGRSEKYNLGSNTGYTVKEIIETAEKIVGEKIPTKITGRREGDPAVLVASYDKIYKDLKWKPTKGLNEIISSAWDWHERNPEGF